MKNAQNWTKAAFLAAAVAPFLCGGCFSYAGKATYSESLSSVPARINPKDRYCIVEVREERHSENELGQSPPSASSAQARLETRLPDWFSSDADAVPVIVVSRSSTESTPFHLLPFSWLTGAMSLCTLGLVPSYGNVCRIRFETELLGAEGIRIPGVPYSGTVWNLAAAKPVLDALWSPSSGWRRYSLVDPKDGSPLPVPDRPIRFDDDDGQKLDAFCASVAQAVQKLTPEERESLRNNDEAWYLDAKLGNRRNRPVGIRKKPPEGETRPPAAPEKHPRIVSQAWNYETRRGWLLLDLSGCKDRNAALAWAREEYLPEYCKTLGTVVSTDALAPAPPPSIRIPEFTTLADGTVLVEFSVDD